MLLKNVSMKKVLVVVGFIVVLIGMLCGCRGSMAGDYGVFLGINEDEVAKLKPYSIVVIEPSEFSIETINSLHS